LRQRRTINPQRQLAECAAELERHLVIVGYRSAGIGTDIEVLVPIVKLISSFQCAAQSVVAQATRAAARMLISSPEPRRGEYAQGSSWNRIGHALTCRNVDRKCRSGAVAGLL
jgi:hypothetical protein